MRTMFGFFCCDLAGATAQSIAAITNRGQALVLNLLFAMLNPFLLGCAVARRALFETLDYVLFSATTGPIFNSRL